VAPKAQPTAGNTYSVAPGGNDNGPGSLAQPWQTLQHAVDSVAPGDTILVQSGAYLGARIANSGTPQAWIALRAAAGASVLLNAPGPENWHGSILEIENGDEAVAYWIIDGLEVSGAPSWGIDSRGTEDYKNHHITIRGNRVHDNGLGTGRTGIFAAFTDDVLIEGNISYGNGEHGIYVNNSSDRFTIRGNTVYANANCGIHLNGDESMGGDGVMTNGVVENNIIYENGTGGGSAINMDGVSSSLVQNNLIYNNHATGIALFYENGAECSQNNRILHNTILMPANGRWAVLVADPACVNNQVFNNILYSYHSYRGSISFGDGIPAGFQSDYNVVVNAFTTNDGDTVLDLSGWQALGFDQHSFTATPETLFVNPAGHDYHLREGSPAIDAASSQGVTRDLEGNLRPAGDAPDMGAFEWGSSPPVGSIFNYLLFLLRRSG